MAKIPRFSSLEEAAKFWDTHDFEDYVGDTQPVALKVKSPRRTRTLTIPVDGSVLRRIEALAARRGVRAEAIVSSWVKERARKEAAAR
ncbi:MAG: hypothetical protein HY721_29590 [Planctomycetes bacterium]|nr:hypothetical protein [Planctomycetota bacterium]